MASHLPFMQFYPADWIADTRYLSLEARGAWIDLLCAMWTAPQRGRLDWTIDMLNHFLGTQDDRDRSTSVWNELIDSGIGELEMHEDANRVTIMSRRMMREENQRFQQRERQSRSRHAKVTEKSRLIYQKSEVRSQKEDTDDRQQNDDPTDPETLTVKDLVDSWNESFSEKLPTVHWPLSKSRHAKASARLREHRSIDFWQTVFNNIDRSRFLLGSNNGTWRCSFDFLVANDTNVIKIFEGTYNHEKNPASNSNRN